MRVPTGEALLDVLWASERLVPAHGGAERAALERLAALADRGHLTRAVCLKDGCGAGPAAATVPPSLQVSLAPAPASGVGYWREKRAVRETLRVGVRTAVALRRPDVLVTQLHGAPAAVAEACRAEIPALLVMPSYESLCKFAFLPRSRCGPAHDCVTCPAADALSPGERTELRRSRALHDWSLRTCAAVVVDSVWMRDTLLRWQPDARPVVIPPVIDAPPAARARFDGHVLLAANRWRADKGAGLLAPLVEAARGTGRRVRVTGAGLSAAEVAALRRRGADVVDPAPISVLLDEASAVLVPSQWEEPFGRVAWEALAAGVPVLASRVGGLREFVPPSRLVSPPEDLAAWRAGIAGLLDDRRRWIDAARAGRAAAASVGAGEATDRLEALLRQVASSIRSTPARRSSSRSKER